MLAINWVQVGFCQNLHQIRGSDHPLKAKWFFLTERFQTHHLLSWKRLVGRWGGGFLKDTADPEWADLTLSSHPRWQVKETPGFKAPRLLPTEYEDIRKKQTNKNP